MHNDIQFFGSIAKVEDSDDGTVTVWGFASTEKVDSQGEIVKREAIEAALPDYMKFANIREMHQPKAAGTAVSAEMTEKGLYIGAHIVDAEAVKKVRAKVYKGFSIGGKATSRDDVNKSIITGLNLTEISLVDRPANPEAVFECFKAEEGGAIGAGSGDVDKFDWPEDEEGISKLADYWAELDAAEGVEKRDYSDKSRKDMADKGQAMKDGSFPIKTKQDLKNAIAAYGRAKNPAAAKKHIIARAKAMGLTDMLPEKWMKKAAAIEGLQKYMGGEVNDAACAIEALGLIMYLFQHEGMEAEGGDTEDQEQVQLLGAAIENIKAFIASEIQEDSTSKAQVAEALQKVEKAESGESDALEKVGALTNELAKAMNDLAERDEQIAKLNEAVDTAKAEQQAVEAELKKLLETAKPGGVVLKASSISKAQDVLLNESRENGSAEAEVVRKADGSIDQEATARAAIKKSHERPLFISPSAN